MAYELIETIEVGSGGAASIEFTSIPQDGVDLLLLVSSRSTTTNSIDSLKISLNGSSANFSYRRLYGTGSSAAQDSGASNLVALTDDDGNTANTFGNAQIYISNYAGSTNKSISADGVSEQNGTAAYQGLYASLWSNTAAITALAVAANNGNLAQYSTASLYKIY